MMQAELPVPMGCCAACVRSRKLDTPMPVCMAGPMRNLAEWAGRYRALHAPHDLNDCAEFCASDKP